MRVEKDKFERNMADLQREVTDLHSKNEDQQQNLVSL